MSARPPIDETVLAALSVALPRVDGVTVQRKVPVHRILTLRTGGPADLLVHVETPDALLGATALLKRVQCPWRVCWPFTPMVARDGGVRGAVITLGSGFDTLQSGPDGSVILGALRPLLRSPLRAPRSGAGHMDRHPGALFASGEAHRPAGPCASRLPVHPSVGKHRDCDGCSQPGRTTAGVGPAPPRPPAPPPCCPVRFRA